VADWRCGQAGTTAASQGQQQRQQGQARFGGASRPPCRAGAQQLAQRARAGGQAGVRRPAGAIVCSVLMPCGVTPSTSQRRCVALAHLHRHQALLGRQRQRATVRGVPPGPARAASGVRLSSHSAGISATITTKPQQRGR
jgi:hypothetical protein